MRKLRMMMFGLVFFTFWLVGLGFSADLIVPDQYPTIQSAINAAQPGDRVLVRPGTYYERITLKSNIVVQSTGGASVTTINGSAMGSVITAFGIINTTLSGFTVTNGLADYGGGIYCEDSSLTITNCTFSGNQANWYGGGIYSKDSYLTVTDCTFSGNRANSSGGGIYNLNGYLTVTNCNFSGNGASSSGGICSEASYVTITNCTFSGNEAYWSGGGIANRWYSSLTVTNCTFLGNLADEQGGGIHNNMSSLTITNCTFSGNRAVKSYGGGICNWGGSSAITNCTFSDNVAGVCGGGISNAISSSFSIIITNCAFSGNRANSGGGISNTESSPAITNCTFSGNEAYYYGGGIANWCYSSPTIINCIFSGNSAGDDGGGIYNNFYSSPIITNCTLSGNKVNSSFGTGGIRNIFYSSPIITNCIIWGNTPWDLIGASATYSNIGTGETSGEGNISADPQFVDPANGDFHLKPTSPCIDKGKNDAPAIPSEDFEGDPRILDGNGDGVAIVDMGADEFVPVASPANTPGKVSGGGWFLISRFRRTLQVDVEYTTGGVFTKTLVKYLNHSNRLNMEATGITSFVISGNTATIKGECKVRGVSGYTFECEVRDTNPDYFAITIKDGSGSVVDSASGTVAGGNKLLAP